MKVDYNIMEKMQLVSILKGYRDTLKVYVEQGLDKEAGYDLSPMIEMVEYHIKKLNKNQQEVDVDKLEV